MNKRIKFKYELNHPKYGERITPIDYISRDIKYKLAEFISDKIDINFKPNDNKELEFNCDFCLVNTKDLTMLLDKLRFDDQYKLLADLITI